MPTKTTDLAVGFDGAKKVTSTALVLDPDVGYERWLAMAPFLGAVHGASPWWIGDWCLHGERAYGEKYAQAMNDTGLDYSTLANYAYVARHVTRSRRREGLGFSIHALVAPLAPEEQKKWLSIAVDNGWTRADLRNALRGAPAGPEIEDASENGAGVVEDLRSCARRVWITSMKHEDHYRVPVESMQRLAAALGEVLR